MASLHSIRSKNRSSRSPFVSERHTDAYLVTKEILRRIDRSAALSCLTSDAVKIHWAGLGSLADRRANGAST